MKSFKQKRVLAAAIAMLAAFGMQAAIAAPIAGKEKRSELVRPWLGNLTGYANFKDHDGDRDRDDRRPGLRGDAITVGPVVGQSPAVSGVPEPSAWALMLAGFGLTGFMIRAARRAKSGRVDAA